MTEEPTNPPLDPHAKVCRNCVNWSPNTGATILKSEDKICTEPHQTRPWTDDEDTCDYFLGSDDISVNVPDHCPNGTMKDPNPNPVDGPVEILISTFGTPTMRVSGNVVSDLDWLRYALRSIRKHCTGFQGITIVHPRHENEMFKPLVDQFDVRLHGFDEMKGKGFIDHMIQMASADQIVPAGTRYVLHTDSDGIFKMPVTPEDYFWEDKPYHIVRSWESLTEKDPNDPNRKCVSDCAQWQGPTDYQLGFKTQIYGMCMNVGAFPMEFYKAYRDHIAWKHGKSFEQFMREGEAVHPATRMDWTAMVGYAYHKMRDKFTWFTVESRKYPADRKQSFWSHQGTTPESIAIMEKLING